jgi:hypothetical protein
MVIFHSYVSLPEGNHLGQGIRNRSTNATGGASDNGHLWGHAINKPSNTMGKHWKNMGNPLSMDVLMGKSWEKHRKRWNMPS